MKTRLPRKQKKAWRKELVKRFERAYPGIKYKLVLTKKRGWEVTILS
ncbi:MAG: hypothetical protein JEZ12_16020 [Desulfobacterium sp.]|nr:hypothetical protein [Desulfobacterium sp.]